MAGRLSAGGLTDPGAQSSQARTVLAHTFGQGDMPLLITVSSPEGVSSTAARTVGTEVVETLSQSADRGDGHLAVDRSAVRGRHR